MARRAGVGVAAELDPAEHPVLGREHHPDPPRRGLDPEEQHQPRRPGRAAPARRARAGSRQRGPWYDSSSTLLVIGRAGLDPHDEVLGRHQPARPDRPTPRPSPGRRRPARRSRGRSSSWTRSRRYTSTCASGSRPSYSCTIVNVGLVTGSVDAERRAPGPARTPSCPRRGRRRAARGHRPRAAAPSAAATARVASGESVRIVTRRDRSGRRARARASRARSRRATRRAPCRPSAAPPTDAASGAAPRRCPARANANSCPRSFVMPSLVSSSSLVAKLPSVTMTRGRISASWRSSHGAHASISSGCGSRLPGGRHFTTLAMYTSSRVRPMPSMSWVSSCPARPTNGSPLQVLLLARDPRRRTSDRRRAARHRTRPACARPRACRARTPTPRPRPRRASRRPRARDAGMRRTSRVTRHSPGRCDRFRSGPRRCYRGATRIASATTSAATDPQPVEVRLDGAGRERDREVAVEAGVRRAQRPRETPSCALCATRWHASLSSTASVTTTTTSVVLAPCSSNGASAGNAGRAGRRGRARDDASRRRRPRRRPR